MEIDLISLSFCSEGRKESGNRAMTGLWVPNWGGKLQGLEGEVPGIVGRLEETDGAVAR